MNIALQPRRWNPHRPPPDPLTTQMLADAGLLWERPRRRDRAPAPAVACAGTLYYHTGNVAECSAGRACPGLTLTHNVWARCLGGKCAFDLGQPCAIPGASLRDELRSALWLALGVVAVLILALLAHP